MTTREKILEQVRGILPPAASPITTDSTLITYGLIDSLALIDLIAALEESFHMKFSNEEMIPENFDSVDAIARLVDGKLPGGAR